MEIIEVLYTGALSSQVVEYVHSSPEAQIIGTTPLIIRAKEGSDLLPGLMKAISYSSMSVSLVKLHRRPVRQLAALTA